MAKGRTPGICPICGGATKPYRSYCSRSCAGKAAWIGNKSADRAARIDKTHDWIQVGDGFYQCRYQEHVRCKDRNCSKCGWNPTVAEERNKALESKRAEKSKTAMYLADRNNGMTFQQIADKYGVSKQTVHKCIGNTSAPNFRPFSPTNCVYPNLRNWLNENHVSLQEFTRRMGDTGYVGNSSAVGTWFRGVSYPHKESIDKILMVTGMTYEQLFATEV